MKKYYFTYAVNGYWTTAVEADNLKEAEKIADDIFDCAGFGEAECLEGQLIEIEDARGDIIWEQ